MSQIQYFLGSNSPAGFYSLYSTLSDSRRIEQVYILKGGPGCGKSSFMRRVARHAQAAGQPAEEILCSGDPDSLDGVLLPGLGAVILDGTAPHVIEPRCPGALDRYVDLSRFYDCAALRPLRAQLQSTTEQYKEHYQQAYRCLGAAGELRRNLQEAADRPEVRRHLERRAAGIIKRELKRSGGHGGTEYRFLSALTHRGCVMLWDTVSAQAERVYSLSDGSGLAHSLLAPILTAAQAAEHRVIVCPDPLAPHRLAHLLLPDLSLAFVTSAPEAPWPRRAYRHLRLDAMADSEELRARRPQLRFTRKVAAALEEEGVNCLAQAKRTHDELEQIYNPHVDFDGVYAAADELSAMLLDQTASRSDAV